MREPLSMEEIKEKFELFYQDSPMIDGGERMKMAMYGAYMGGVIEERKRTTEMLREDLPSFSPAAPRSHNK
jgi:hypothetical protein